MDCNIARYTPSFNVNVREFDYLMSTGFILKDEDIKKVIVVTKERASKIGVDKTIDECMKYTLKNRKEVIFHYNTDTREIITDAYSGTLTRCFGFVNMEMVDREKYIGVFHTHAITYGKGKNFFSLDDIKHFNDDFFRVIILGCPADGEIIILKRIHIEKDRNLACKLFEILTKYEKLFVLNWERYYSVSNRGEVTLTEEGHRHNRIFMMVVRKLLKNVITIREWKNT